MLHEQARVNSWDFNSPDIIYVIMALGVFNSLLIIILYIVGKTWHIKVEYKESFYIGFASFCIIQCEIISVPIMFTVVNEPKSFYVLSVSSTLVQSITVLLCIFLPKWYYMNQLKEKERKKKNLQRRNLPFEREVQKPRVVFSDAGVE